MRLQPKKSIKEKSANLKMISNKEEGKNKFWTNEFKGTNKKRSQKFNEKR